MILFWVLLLGFCATNVAMAVDGWLPVAIMTNGIVFVLVVHLVVDAGDRGGGNK